MRGINTLATGKELLSRAELDMTFLTSWSQAHKEEISEERVKNVDANPQCKTGICVIPNN